MENEFDINPPAGGLSATIKSHITQEKFGGATSMSTALANQTGSAAELACQDDIPDLTGLGQINENTYISRTSSVANVVNL